jgi:IclR family mhp operon transcriptional activator
MNRRIADPSCATARNLGSNDIKSLRQGLAALRFVASGRGLSSGELAAVLRTSRPAAFRLLQTLCAAGYLERDGSGNRVRYFPLQRIRELSAGYDGSVKVLDVAVPLLVKWTQESGWPLAISVPDHDHCIVRFNTDRGAARALARYRPGARMNALMSASAMVSLAFQPRHIQRAALIGLEQVSLPGYAPRRSASEIESVLQTTRRNGYAIFRPLGLREASVAVPVWHDGVVRACLTQRYMLVAERGTSGHMERLTKLRWLSEEISAIAEADSVAPGNAKSQPHLAPP